MARQPLDPPSPFGKLVSSAIRREMGDRRMSGRELARVLSKSEAYVRQRLNDTFEFTLADVERFALEVVGEDPEMFIGAIERRPSEAANVTPLRRPDVGASPEDQEQALRRVAKSKSRDRGETPEEP